MNPGRLIKLSVILTSMFIGVAGLVCVGLAEVLLPASWLFGDPSLKPSLAFDGDYNSAVDLEIIFSIVGQCLILGSLLARRKKAKNIFEFAGLAVLWTGLVYLAYTASHSTLESILDITLQSAIPFVVCSLASIIRHLIPKSS